jgi:hypothetical protein
MATVTKKEAAKKNGAAQPAAAQPEGVITDPAASMAAPDSDRLDTAGNPKVAEGTEPPIIGPRGIGTPADSGNERAPAPAPEPSKASLPDPKRIEDPAAKTSTPDVTDHVDSAGTEHPTPMVGPRGTGATKDCFTSREK